MATPMTDAELEEIRTGFNVPDGGALTAEEAYHRGAVLRRDGWKLLAEINRLKAEAKFQEHTVDRYREEADGRKAEVARLDAECEWAADERKTLKAEVETRTKAEERAVDLANGQAAEVDRLRAALERVVEESDGTGESRLEIARAALAEGKGK